MTMNTSLGTATDRTMTLETIPSLMIPEHLLHLVRQAAFFMSVDKYWDGETKAGEVGALCDEQGTPILRVIV